ncbi:hypothetical protein [Rubellimicrobium aerolatum]|uniref:Histidine kinase n=1 Tax=Rubellimicrobium aerolatum TaxID=490979 RepID=A0ABW0SAN6_9RHOB|nr:hypothetical protein [Rubellimicrobium aerolatum]MBP1806097.1 DNA-binding IclR family transcriptional regulator [Rubellimicrobium aerolatum]
MVFLRVLVMVALVLTAVGLLLGAWLLRRERRRLREAWEAGDHLVKRETVLREEMAAYRRRLWRWLPWLVVALPMAGLLVVLYLLNVS